MACKTDSHLPSLIVDQSFVILEMRAVYFRTIFFTDITILTVLAPRLRELIARPTKFWRLFFNIPFPHLPEFPCIS